MGAFAGGGKRTFSGDDIAAIKDAINKNELTLKQ